jgi:hypothetical protein
MDVMNLKTGEFLTYTTDARSASIAAHAQSRGDWNTWDYERRYGSLVVSRPTKKPGMVCHTCGDFTALEPAGQKS